MKYSFQKDNLSGTRTAFRGNYHFTGNAEVRDSDTNTECNQNPKPEEGTLYVTLNPIYSIKKRGPPDCTNKVVTCPHLKCGWYKLRCAVNIKYTLDFVENLI